MKEPTWKIENWRPVDKKAFNRYLKDCPAYYRYARANGVEYYFRHTLQRFAFIVGGRILCSPAILEKSRAEKNLNFFHETC